MFLLITTLPHYHFQTNLQTIAIPDVHAHASSFPHKTTVLRNSVHPISWTIFLISQIYTVGWSTINWLELKNKMLQIAIHPFPCVLASHKKDSVTSKTQHTFTYRSKHFSHLLLDWFTFDLNYTFLRFKCARCSIYVCGWWLSTWILLRASYTLILFVYLNF